MTKPEESKRPNRYEQLIERIFTSHYTKGMEEFTFARDEIIRHAGELGIELPRNLGDVIYSFRYRAELPRSVRSRAPKGRVWVIHPAGRGRYRFVAEIPFDCTPNPNLAVTKVPDATPEIIAMYALTDEQALLAKVRYNRLLDIFTGVTCYSLQSHLRTTLPGGDQLETDELYIGVNRRGAHYVFPVEAKSVRERLGQVQIAQDMQLCKVRFPALICRPIGAQFMEDDLIALLEFEDTEGRMRIVGEEHYRLVPHSQVSADDLETYRCRTERREAH